MNTSFLTVYITASDARSFYTLSIFIGQQQSWQTREIKQYILRNTCIVNVLHKQCCAVFICAQLIFFNLTSLEINK